MSKAAHVAREIRRRIYRNAFIEGRLPSEPDLARDFNASRATVRQALAELEQAGLIARQHGRGTFVNQHVQGIRTRLEEVWDFDEMIRMAGYTAGVRHQSMSLDVAQPYLLKILNLENNEEVLITSNVFLADGNPVISCVDIIPARLVNRAYRDEELHGPVYTFLAERCNQQIDYNIADVRPVVANKELAALLACEVGVPLHYFEEIGYNAGHEPIIYSREYYRPEFFNFKVVRKMVSGSERVNG
jgi:GntR family transcriptional regulator